MDPQEQPSTQPPVASSSSGDDPRRADSTDPAPDHATGAPGANGLTPRPRPTGLAPSTGAAVAWLRMAEQNRRFGAGLVGMSRPRVPEAFRLPIELERKAGYLAKLSTTSALVHRHATVAKAATVPFSLRIADSALAQLREALVGSNVAQWRAFVRSSSGLDLAPAFAAAAGWKHLNAAWGGSVKTTTLPFSLRIAEGAWLARTTLLSDADARATALKLTQAVAAHDYVAGGRRRPVQDWDAWPPGGVTPQSAADSAPALDTETAPSIRPESPATLERDLRLRLIRLGVVLLVAGSVASAVAGIRLLALAGEDLGTIAAAILGEATLVLAYPSFVEAKRRLVAKEQSLTGEASAKGQAPVTAATQPDLLQPEHRTLDKAR